MVPCLIFIILAFIWLLYESNWMRIRLPVGASKEMHKTIRLWKFSYTEHIKGTPYLGISNQPIAQNPYSIPKRGNSISLFSAGITEPICGWDWLLTHEHPIIENRIEIIAHNCKHNIHLCDNPNIDYGRIMKEICQIAFKNNPGRKSRHKVNKRKAGLTFNPNYKLA